MEFYFIKRWLPVILWASVIFYLSSLPNLSSGLDHDFEFRKLAHIFVYFVLTFLLFRALYDGDKQKKHRILCWAFLISVLYAISDEYHQTFVFGRSGSIKDVLVDSIGVLTACLLIYKFKFFSRAKKD